MKTKIIIALTVLVAITLVIIDIAMLISIDNITSEIGTRKESEILSMCGEKDTRPFYLIDDSEVQSFRYNYQPVKGKPQYDYYVIPISGGSKEDQRYIEDLLVYLPESVKSYLSDNSWQVEICDSINSSSLNETIGKTSFDLKLITVTMDEPFTIYHEIGHIIEHNNRHALSSNEISDELQRLCCHSAYSSLYIYMNRKEQLSECLFDYIWYPKEMQEQAPVLYNTLRKIVDEEPYKRYTTIEG